ncbi:MAG: glycine cleavage system protein GcvH [Chlamydiales bacterium]|nr:glycine cleavage system protein GcvH [Chlamydiales bacterium]
MKYTDSHEWIKIANNEGTVGITHFARKELGQIVYIELPKVGQRVESKEEVAVLESTKAAADIYSPVAGTIIAVNLALKENIQLINQDPENQGWIYKINIAK